MKTTLTHLISTLSLALVATACTVDSTGESTARTSSPVNGLTDIHPAPGPHAEMLVISCTGVANGTACSFNLGYSLAHGIGRCSAGECWPCTDTLESLEVYTCSSAGDQVQRLTCTGGEWLKDQCVCQDSPVAPGHMDCEPAALCPGVPSGTFTLDPALGACVEGSCCQEFTDCAASQNCRDCARGIGTDCASDPAYAAYDGCTSTLCGAPSGGVCGSGLTYMSIPLDTCITGNCCDALAACDAEPNCHACLIGAYSGDCNGPMPALDTVTACISSCVDSTGTTW